MDGKMARIYEKEINFVSKNFLIKKMNRKFQKNLFLKIGNV